jgi:hypothetical protein
MKLRELDRRLQPYGGMKGFYLKRKAQGYPRKLIAEHLGMSVYALEKWITKWEREGQLQ